MHHRGVIVGLFALLSGLFWTFWAAGATGAAAEEDGFTARVAAERSSGGLPAYAVASDLGDVARAHAARMASEQRLYHNPSLGSQVRDWEAVGENVGVGATVDDVHRAFMASATHRRAILSTDFTQVGMGVASSSDGRLWVAQVFRRPAGATAAGSPAPTTTPAPAPRTARPAPAPAPVDPAARAAAAAAARAKAAAATRAAVEAEAARAAATEAAARDEAAAAAVRDQLAADLTTTAIEPSGPRAAVLSAALPDAPVDGRDVTLPIGVAASLLFAVVLGLLAEVLGRYPRSAWRRQRSQASISSSRSPSSTAWTLPVS